jgi:hypothetical protein
MDSISIPPLSEDFWQTPQRAKAIMPLSRCKPPSPERVEKWTSGLLTIDDSSATIRGMVYEWCYTAVTLGSDLDRRSTTTWLTEGAFTNFVRRVRTCDGPPPWSLLWKLLNATELTVAEPLYSLVDDGSCLTLFFRAVWEARFLLAEKHQSVDNLFRALPKWMLGETLLPADREVLDKAHITRELSPVEQIDTLFFMLALAHQNGIFERIVFVFDGLERAFRQPARLRQSFFSELHDLTSAAKKWSRLGSSTGLVLGFSGSGDFYKELEVEHSKLAKIIRSALV